MKYKTACHKARQLARKTEEITYVVYDGEDTEYQPASEEDMDTFFYGCNAIIAFEINGDVAP